MAMSSREARPRRPLAHAGNGIDDGPHVDLAELELEPAGIDGGEIQNVVDDGQQRARRGRDVVQILALLAAQVSEDRVGHKLAEADDVRERRRAAHSDTCPMNWLLSLSAVTSASLRR